ncbi:hypothetical protein B5F40_06475 [Gordonibacter sp. An230]|uniref:response regulator transcription factor n=1 Tax=Gordonibacter sp. An230 TaxID=1965592 RepID=UPI000B37F3F7|nr:helix-turn-helix transcriptional regulator [Gordonibacter sp. An230]OUO90598.1 hypothetical protein B5F40_06475 [Gordonibacter sp. An230]
MRRFRSVEEAAAVRAGARSLVKTVVGSSFLWAWGFLCYLSPALIPQPNADGQSVGLEYGFFASQGAVVLFALVVALRARRRRIVVRTPVFLGAAVASSLTVVVLAQAVRASALPVVLACGAIDGFCVALLGAAWGARYSLGSRGMRPLVVVSFLAAYVLYLLAAHVPGPWSMAVACALPLASWALWMSDASARHELSADVFPDRDTRDGASMPGELSAGLWEARVLPWRAIGVLVAAAFVGNLVASVVMGRGYASVDSLFFGGVVVCACIATMSLVPLTAGRNALSVEGVYRITLTFTAVGLVAIMVFGAAGISAGGALVQGSAFFLQVLVFLVVTQSTQEEGLSPLLSFSVGQALIAGVVFVGNVLGKQVFALFGSEASVLDVVCGCGLLALFFMLVSRASAGEGGAGAWKAQGGVEEQTGKGPLACADDGASALSGTSSAVPSRFEPVQAEVAPFAERYDLTPRETEVLGYLVRGRTLPYIADALFVTTGTVKTHTVHIYRKAQVSSRQELLDLFEAGA